MIHLAWMSNRLGRRGSVLVLLGAGFVLYGLNFLIGDVATYPKVLGSSPFWFLGALWMFNGAVALWHAPKREPGADAYGFAALSAMPAMWVLLYLASFVGAVVGESWGDQGALLRALVWLLLLGVIMIEAGSPEIRPEAPEARTRG